LENNKLGDQLVARLCKILEDSKSIKKLNISKNNVSDLGAKSVAKFIEENSSI
jgi:hypothetical protein